MATQAEKAIPEFTRQLLTRSQRRLLDTKYKSVPPPWMVKHVQNKVDHWKRFQERGANFLVGKNKVYLPDFVVALMRAPHLPPSQAQFRVPLHFTKLDLRDYLFHAYSVRVSSVRSYIQQSKKTDPSELNPDARVLRFLKKGEWSHDDAKPLHSPVADRKLSRRLEKAKEEAKELYDADWDEAKVKKIMIVDLEKPFLWPPKLSDKEMDDVAGQGLRAIREGQKTKEELEKGNRRGSVRRAKGVIKEEEKYRNKHARALLDGRTAWRDDPEALDTRELHEPRESKTVVHARRKMITAPIVRRKGSPLSGGLKDNLKMARAKYLEQAFRRKALNQI